MTENKQIIIDVCPYQGECSVSGCKRNDDGCFVRQLFEERYRAEKRIVELNKTIKAKEQECEELNKDNSILKDILSYPKYTNENAYNELLKLSKAELIKNLIESHQHGESTTQVFYRSISEENKKYKQTLIEIKEIAEPYKMTIKKICGNCKKYDNCHACCYKDINCYKYTSAETNACEEFTYLDEFVPNILANNIQQKISEVIK